MQCTKRCFNMRILLVVCACVFELVNCQEFCMTPFNVIGECVNTRSCQAMHDFLSSKKPFPEGYLLAIKGYLYCRRGERYSMCCPNTGSILPPMDETNDFITETPTTDTSTIETPTTTPEPVGTTVTSPPDPLKHRNLHLLPNDQCGYFDPDSDKIRGGKNSNLNEFPWMALLSYKDPSRKDPIFKCGGSIINDRYILTAAHCIQDLDFPLVGVRLGEYDIKTEKDCVENNDGKIICAPPVQNIGVEKIIPHHGFDLPTIQNDIGLLRLSKKMQFADNVKPICLPIQKHTQEIENTHSFVTGWGFLDNHETPAFILQKVRIPFVNRDECQAAYGSEKKISHKQLCAGAKEHKGSCPGDSGGPLQYLFYWNTTDSIAYVQQGVVSYGPRRCGSIRIPEVYASVSYYMDWILDQLEP